ncbi:MAG: transposase [Aquisalimonadaceae bacterium]
MRDYRRTAIAGATCFFTVATFRRRPLFAAPENVQMLRTVIRRVRGRHPFRIDAMVVLPDHVHAVWTLPAGDDDFAKRWRLIKSGFSRGIPRPAVNGLRRCGEHKVWQRRYREHSIGDEDDYRRHVDYIHYNPVRHGLVERPGDWPYSSFRRAVERGDYPQDWGRDVPVGMELRQSSRNR